MTETQQVSLPRRRAGGARGPSIWLAVPALAFFVVFAVVPLFGVVVLSFAEWDGLSNPTFAGLANWKKALGDPQTHHSVWLSVKVILLSVLFQAPMSLFLGVFMAGKQRWREVLSVLFFLPLLFSAAAIAIAFKSLLDPNFGIGPATGIPFLSQDWFGKPDLALYVALFVIAWSFIPFHSLLYQAGARQIPTQLYEAAMIDGASQWQQFWQITIPQLRYTMVTSTTLILVGSLTYFDLIYVLTAGGPGNATRILPLHMYLLGFRSFDMGYASVISVILVVIGLTMSLGLTRLTGSHRMESQQAGA